MKTPADYCADIAKALEKVPKCEWTRHCGHVHIPETDDNSAGLINLNAVFNRLVGKFFARYIAACHPKAMRSILEEREQSAIAVAKMADPIAAAAELRRLHAMIDHQRDEAAETERMLRAELSRLQAELDAEAENNAAFDQERAERIKAQGEAKALAAMVDRLQAAGGQGVDDVYACCRECEVCGHAGINDDSHTTAACSSCGWSGPTPETDECPGCKNEGTMCAACPECGGNYKLIADATLPALAHPPAAPALVPLSEQDIVSCIIEAECLGAVKMSFEAGLYDIDRPSLNATKFTRAITKALAARNGLTVGGDGGV